ncbi:MAG: fibro-slime domain-containing protein [Lachnospiraceae bacterium]|nr:fibro-slime domain-containing protein [Lachnospiraceae bacterium]
MKTRRSKRVLALALVLCTVLALLPVGVFAEGESTASEAVNGMTVEYFTSTLYNWDEDGANAATAEADKADSSTVSWTSTTVSYSQQGNYSTYTSGSYYYLNNGEYIQVTSLSASRGSGQNQNTITWTINGTYSTTTTQQQGPNSGNSGLTLYYQSTSTSYEGKGFYFTNGGNMASSVPEFSKWVSDYQNYMIYSGLAASKLSDSSNAPFNDDTVNAANLFASSSNSYTDVYTNVQVPFVYDENTGYYTLDSDSNAVYFANGTGASNTTMEIADLPAAHSYGSYYATGFLPFNSLSSNTPTEALESGSSSSYVDSAYIVTDKSSNSGTTTTTDGIDWGFGMVTSVDFQMTDDGKDEDGNAITFEFSGDDDVWVYIDGYLVLDIGGTHDAITGTIDFSTGDVELTAGSYGKIGDIAVTGSVSTTDTSSSTLSQDNIYDVLGTTLTGFASEGNHTLTIYYMERGRGRSNCLIKFNLPQKDSVSVTKTIDEYYTSSEYEISDDVMKTLNNMDFTFTLYNGSSVVANKSYSLYDSAGTLVGTGSTDSAGTFTIKNGQTATFKNISLDEESSYYVVETSPGDRWTAKWTATSSVSSATISGGSSLTSDTVTVTGSSTATDTITFVCENSYSYGSVQPDVDVNDDTIVLDYGLPVEVNVRSNDNITAYGVAVNSTMALVGADESGKVTGTYGYATINDDGNIVYTLTEDFCGIETIQYTVSASAYNTETEKEETQSGTATLTIIPATSVYYEENFSATCGTDDSGNLTMSGNFVSIKTSKATFSTVSDGEEYGTYQETGFVGTTDDSTYGTDAVYLNNLCDSYGTSLKVDTTNGAAQYTYSFTGTGTTIYGRVNKNTGYIKVTVTDSDGDEVSSQYIDTINLVTSDDDGQILDETLYNIPIYQETALERDYDTYTVTIYVYKAGMMGHSGNSDFYLDGIRVYNPMGTSTTDNTGYTTAASAYATDGEANTAVVNIRTKVVADYEEEYADDAFTLTDVDGNIVDAYGYSDIGPDQEFYLKKDYNLTFALLNWDSQSYKIYLGMKAPNGIASQVTVGSGTFSIGNSADCYYDISDYVVVSTLDDGTVVGYVSIEGVSGLTALTDIKVTGVDKFNLAYDEDIDVTSLTSLYMVSTAYAASLSAEDEEEAVEVFTPESIALNCGYASKTKKATVTVLTSKDVSYVTIDGVKMTQKNASGKYRFTASFTKVAAGTTYEIVCYNADGVASQVYTVTAE